MKATLIASTTLTLVLGGTVVSGVDQGTITPAQASTSNAMTHCPTWFGTAGVKQKVHKKYARAVYLRVKVSLRARLRMTRMRKCAYSLKARVNMRDFQKKQKRDREDRQRYVPNAHLQRIAQCESGGDPGAISPGGQYRGKYQFSLSTWQSVGGQGDPAVASEQEQDKRAMILYRVGGPGHWPICQHR